MFSDNLAFGRTLPVNAYGYSDKTYDCAERKEKSMKGKSHVFRGLASLFLALLIIFQLVGQIADSWSNKVNELLGASEADIERSENKEDYKYLSDFENPSELIQAEIDLNTRLAAEGAVVLKGSPALEGTAVTLLGMRSGEKMQFGGSMGELTDVSNIVTLDQAMEKNGFSINPNMVQFYKDQAAEYAPVKTPGGNVVSSYEEQGTTIGEVPVSKYEGAKVEGYQDAAVIVFGRDAGESCCFYPGKNGLLNPDEFSGSLTGNILSLSNDERDLLAWAKRQGFSKIVVLLNSSTSMEIEELKQDDAVDSIIWVGNPGAYGTYGIAKLLSGEMQPCGHLPDTFAVNSALSPAAQNLGIYAFENADEIETTDNNALRNSWYLVESESIYIGYKYYETRYFDSMLGQGKADTAQKGETADGGRAWNYDNEVSYSFGYGIEGSSFSEEIVDAKIDWSGDTESTVTVRVTNTGDQAARHVIQLYVSVPYTGYDRQNGVEKSAIQLIGYARTGEAQETGFTDAVLLEPGASEEVVISFNAQDFYSYDMTHAHNDVTGAYLLEAGEYCFATGNGAHDAVQSVLKMMYADRAKDLQPTGAARVEKLDSDLTLTESNGVTIQNQMDGSDLNSWKADTTVTNLTRNDWAGTFPESVEKLSATDEMIQYLRNETYDAVKAAESYDGPSSFTYGADNGVRAVDLAGLDYDDPLFDKILDQLTLEDMVNHYLAFNQPIKDIALPVEFRADSPLGMITTIGQHTDGSIYGLDESAEGYGHYTNVYTGAPTVAATFSPLLQSEEGRLIANDAIWCGYNTWYGPGLNMHRTPYNGRNLGYYSEDSVLSGMAALYVNRSMTDYGIVTNTKHFALNDQETNRDGLAVFISEQAARENELRGFQIPIRDGCMKGLMTAFNRIGCTHSSAHAGLMNGILRGEWGFQGYMITDSVKSAQYFLPRECLMAGNDMMLGGSNNGKVWDFTEDKVKDDIVLQAAMRETMHRKLYVYANSIMFNGVTADSSAGGGLVWWALLLRIVGGISFAGFAVCLVLFIRSAQKERGQ